MVEMDTSRALARRAAGGLALAALLLGAADASALSGAAVERSAPTRLTIRWSDADRVDVYQSDSPDATAAQARLISAADDDGEHMVEVEGGARPYFLLRERGGRQALRVAERVLPLERGSNFRDLGGYPAAGGRHVKWGAIFRSGGTPLLSAADLAQIQGLGLRAMFDLRSSEERVIAPTRIEGVRYEAIGYSMGSMMGGSPGAVQVDDGGRLYRNFPRVFAPQVREIFASLLGGQVPIVYNCSAGQDRTGFATAMLLSALGVPREVILEDYHLSTSVRRPEHEMPRIDTVAQAGNPVALFFAKYQADPAHARPAPLYGPDRKSLLSFAFEAIEERWGSVDAYLATEIGLSRRDLAELRRGYTE